MKINYWTILTPVYRSEKYKYRKLVKAKCKCGKIREIIFNDILAERSKCCGCDKSGHITHGMTKTPIWKTWISIKERCHNPNATNYKYYGGRGIKMSIKWEKSFKAFYKDVGDKPHLKMSLDRINNNKGYFPSNVRWATQDQQIVNTRRSIIYNGQQTTITRIAKSIGCHRSLLEKRIKKGMTIYEAVESAKQRTIKLFTNKS